MRQRSRKPLNWPAYMTEKRLAEGAVAYYWSPPTWAKAAGCPMRSEPLGKDYASAKRRCDDILNPQFRSWRTKGDGEIATPAAAFGTFDWLRLQAQSHPRFKRRGPRTQKQDIALLTRVADFKMTDGRRLGVVSIRSLVPGVVDRLLEKLGIDKDGNEMARTRVAIAAACRSAWAG